MENLQRIQKNLVDGFYKSNPKACAEDRAILSGEYAWICGQMETILSRKPAIWNEIRKGVKSDTACDRAYEMTIDGLDEIGLKLRLKSCEKMMQGLSSLLKLAEGESKNMY
jgi:hypothetical protein